MKKFLKEFNTLNYAILNSENILIFAHSHPDSDTIGASLALKDYIRNLGKKVEVACFDPLPEYINNLISDSFEFPANLDLARYKLVIAVDSVERGFQKTAGQFNENQVVALLDHHPDITLKKDINIIDPEYSSVCEIVYDFFLAGEIKITRRVATCLLLGILGDTGMFQHSNTSPKVLEISSRLMKLGAPLAKIAGIIFSHKKISTLKLWGKAFEKAKIYPKNGMIMTVLTKNDIREYAAGTEDIAQVASILNTVPGTKFALVLSEREGNIVKGSLRSEEYKGIDVSSIAATFGGGGHKLASGFEVKGKIVETETGWKIE